MFVDFPGQQNHKFKGQLIYVCNKHSVKVNVILEAMYLSVLFRKPQNLMQTK